MKTLTKAKGFKTVSKVHTMTILVVSILCQLIVSKAFCQDTVTDIIRIDSLVCYTEAGYRRIAEERIQGWSSVAQLKECEKRDILWANEVRYYEEQRRSDERDLKDEQKKAKKYKSQADRRGLILVGLAVLDVYLLFK